MRKFLFLFFFLPISIIANDTIAVQKAYMVGPFTTFLPYATDSVDMQARSYDAENFLTENNGKQFLTQTPTATILRGEPLKGEGNGTLRVLRFTLDTDRYLKVQLSVSGLKHYKIYRDGLPGDNNLTLTPGRTEVALTCFSTGESKDTFRVDLIGKSLSALTVNDAGKHTYGMRDLLLGLRYYNVLISPTGKYLLTFYRNVKEDGESDYITVLSETKNGRELMRRNHYFDVKWLPNRDVLYYTQMVNGLRELITLDPQTNAEKTIAKGLPENDFSISPNEDYIIYTVDQEGIKENNGLRRIDEPDDRQPDWRTRTAVYRYDFKSNTAQRLTFGKSSVTLSDISPDGRRLLLSYTLMDTRKIPFHRTTLVEMDAYNGRTDTLLADTAFIGTAYYTYDGGSLIIKGSPNAFDNLGSDLPAGQIGNGFDYRLFLYNIAQKKTVALLPDFKPSVSTVVTSKKAPIVYFAADDGFDRSLFGIDVRTRAVRKYSLPVTLLQNFSIATHSSDPDIVFIGQTAVRARECFLGKLTTTSGKYRKTGDVNFDELTRDVAIGESREWSFRSQRGDTIRGFYYLPPNFDASRKYPVLVYYYGGCMPVARSLEAHYPFAVYAGQGYIVYVIEPSGAVGFGQAFAARHVNTWGDGTADDIIEGTKQFLAAHPYANAERVGCMGASYGGFMTQFLQTKTDIFRTAVSHAGISNIASYWGGGYWGYTYGEVAQYGSFPWNNADLYVKHSPLFNADKIHTPLLLLHGTADTNVPPTESLQMFTALRILGRPVSLVQIEGENHVIVGYAKRLKWQETIFAWLAYWLKDQPDWWQELYPRDKFGQN